MESASIRLGKIAGVPVGISWSLLVVAAVFTLGLAEGQYPNTTPDHGRLSYWLAAGVTVLAFFMSILIHELSHAVVARRHGIGVEGITLWFLGGVAQLRGEPTTPSAEFQIAGVGPLSSAILALGFWVLSWTGDQLGASPLIQDVFLWLALINLVLAVFNSVPAAPLDGGRILAAVWWWRTGDRTKARLGAANAGQLLGGALMAYAAWELLYRDGTFALWTAIVGWFIWRSARSEGQTAVTRHSLAGITAVEAARPDPPVVDEWLTVEGLVAVLGDGGDHTAFVVREHDGVLRSVVTLDDIKRVSPNRRGEVTLHEIAVPIAQLTTAWTTDPLITVLDRMDTEGRPEIVVYDTRMCLVGVISRADLSRLIRRAGTSGSAPPPPPPPPRRDPSIPS